jgi:hypothetical protein
LVLTTQNPVDLDYRGLTNAGTWFIGKLQTDRDKMRVLEGLEGLDIATGAGSARSYFDRLISSLDKRVFIMHNVHQDGPVVFMTRWAMSYLRGPLTKSQIRTLMEPHKEQLAAAAPRPLSAEVTPTSLEALQAVLPQAEPGFSPAPMQLHSEINQYFLQLDTPLERALFEEERRRGTLFHPTVKQKVYHPAILGWATVHFQDARRKVAHSEEHSYLLPVPEDLAWVDWPKGRIALTKDDLLVAPPADALYADVPASLGDAKKLKALQKDFVNFLYREIRLTLYHNTALRIYSAVGESEGRFVRRCQEQAAALQEAEEHKTRAKYEARLARLEDRLRREERELHADRIEYEGRKREERLTLSESLWALLRGRRRLRTFSETSRRRRLASQAQADVEESEEVISDLERQMDEVRREWDEALSELADRVADMSRQIEQVQIKPKKTDIDVTVFGVGWVPSWRIVYEDGSGAVQTILLQAYRGGQTQPRR